MSSIVFSKLRPEHLIALGVFLFSFLGLGCVFCFVWVFLRIGHSTACFQRSF